MLKYMRKKQNCEIIRGSKVNPRPFCFLFLVLLAAPHPVPKSLKVQIPLPEWEYVEEERPKEYDIKVS